MLATNLPDIWDPKAVYCLVGIVYGIICFWMADKSIKGWVKVLNMMCIGFIILWVVAPTEEDSFPDQANGDWWGHTWEDRNGNLISPTEIIGKSGVWYDAHFGEDVPKRIYNMHVNGKISPKLFHPACLIWSPGFALVLALFGGITGMNKL
jgi:hypothetical protein